MRPSWWTWMIKMCILDALNRFCHLVFMSCFIWKLGGQTDTLYRCDWLLWSQPLELGPVSALVREHARREERRERLSVWHHQEGGKVLSSFDDSIPATTLHHIFSTFLSCLAFCLSFFPQHVCPHLCLSVHLKEQSYISPGPSGQPAAPALSSSKAESRLYVPHRLPMLRPSGPCPREMFFSPNTLCLLLTL